MMYRGSGIFGGGGLIGLIIIAIAIYFIIKYLNQRNNDSSIFKKKISAIDILNERYAKGEIDEDEYNRMRNTLEE